MAAIINSTNPDLSAFQARGGKLIIPQGWDDTLADPGNAINYYESVVRHIAGAHGKYSDATAKTGQFFRLFMVPGMGHCALGPGPNNFGQFAVLPGSLDPSQNVLSALEAWVERGQAPEKLIATKYKNDDPSQTMLRTRPLCPYPQEAAYKGTGSTDDAANFVCRPPHTPKKSDHRLH